MTSRWRNHIVKLEVGELQTNCYVVLPVEGSEAVVVDPGGEGTRVRGELTRRGLTLGKVILTHAHIDHVMGLPDLLKGESGDIDILLHSGDSPLMEKMHLQAEFMGIPLPAVSEPVRALTSGDEVKVGGRIFEILHTPGHSPGSICLLLRKEGIVLTGDTLFWAGVGRTDLWGGSWPSLRRSLQEDLLTLNCDFFVLPGHGSTTTIGDAVNWFRETDFFSEMNEVYDR